MNNFNFTKSIFLTFALFVGVFHAQKAAAQCGQVQYTISLVSATYTCGDGLFGLFTPQPMALGTIVSGMTPTVPVGGGICMTPANPSAGTITGSATIAETFTLPSVCTSPGALLPAPTTVVAGFRLFEDDAGLPCDIDADDDDDTGWRNVTFNILRNPNGCFNTLVYDSSLPNVGCWTNVRVRLTISYPNPAPIATNVSIQQGNAAPQLQVTTGYGGTYTWANGAGTGLTYTPATGIAANQVNTCVPGTYPVTLTATHECSGAVSAPATANVEVFARCPEIQTVTATPNPACESSAIGLGVTFVPPPTCAGLTFVEGINYLLQWYMDGTKIIDGLGTDGVASTADDIINLTNTTFTPAYTGTTCTYQDHVFEARIICLQTAKPLALGGPCPYGVNGAMQMTYEGNAPNNTTNAAAGATGTVCPGVSGSLAPPGHDLAVPANSATGTFNTCTGRFSGNGLTWTYDLSALPPCAIVSSVDYVFTGHSAQNCAGSTLYGQSWSQEANFVFYAPGSAGPTGATPGGANTSFFWHNAQFTSGGTNTGGAYTFAATNSTALAGTSASGVWKILFFDDYDDTGGTTNLDGEVRKVGLTVRYTLPPGCGTSTIAQALPVRIWDKLDSGVDFTPPSGCGYTVTNVCSNASAFYSATGAAGTYTLVAPPVTPTNGQIVYYEVRYNDPAAPTTCTTTGTYTINNLPNATFAYNAPTYCKSDPNPTPTQAQVGVYTATAGLVLNATTGLIDLVATPVGCYTVTHTVTLGVCSDVKATNICVVASPTVNTPQDPCNAPGTGYTPSVNIVSAGALVPVVTGAAGTITGSAPNYVWTGILVGSGSPTNITITNPNNPAACNTVAQIFNRTCTPTTPVSCAECGGLNLASNASFETGTGGFTSDYTPDNCVALATSCGGGLCEYRYAVYNSASGCIPTLNPNIGDHTTGTGSFMVVNYPSGNVNPNNRIWCQSINLAAATTYSFGANFLNLLPQGSTFADPQVAFTVNGTVIGNTITTQNDQLWHFSGYQFTNTTGGAATLCITSQNNGQLGNDLGIDDIILRSVSTSTTFPNLQPDVATICVNAAGLPIAPVTIPTPIPVLTNDNGNGSNLDATTLTIAVNPDPSIGDATVVGSNIVFTPLAGVAITAPVTFTYRVCNAAGCCNCTVVTISPEVAPVPSITAVPTSVCAGASTSLTVTPAGLTYDWMHVAGTSDPQTVSVTPSAPSSSYTVVATSAAGCKGTTTIAVAANPIPVATLTGPLTSCATPLVLTATPNTGVTYTWSAGATAIAATNTANAAGAGTYTVTVTTPSGCASTASWTITPGAAAVPTITQTISCGSVTLALTPTTYTNYNWAHLAGTNDPSSVAVTTSGVYTLTVTGTGGCLATATTNVTIPVALSGSVQLPIKNVSCFGGNDGMATVIAANGTPPYSFSPSSTMSALIAGSYSITITDAATCSVVVPFAISQPNQLVVTATHIDRACTANNGSITPTATGGTLAYTYTISGGSFTGLAAGSYTVTVTDSKLCTASMIVVISTINTPITATATVTQNSNCAGAAIGIMSASGSGGLAPYTYQVDNNGGFVPGNIFTGLAVSPPPHTLITKDANGCTGSVSFIITQPVSTVTGSITAQTNIVGCNGANTGAVTVAAANGVAPYTYTLQVTQSNGTFINLAAGGHTVIISDANSCTTNVLVTITQSGSVVSGTAAVTSATCNTNGSATITPSGGGAPYTYSLNGSAYQSNPSFLNLAAGVYPISIRDNLGCVGSVSVTITANPILLTLAASAQAARCNTNGSVVLSAAQGAPTYYYSVDGSALQPNNAFANLITGAHIAVVTDANGCTKNLNFNITDAPNTLTAAVTTTNPVICNGTATGSFTVQASNGQSPYSYSNGGGFQSNTTFSNLSAGTYTVTASDANGCRATASAIIAPVAALTMTATVVDVACYGNSTASITLQGVGGTAPYGYYTGINLSNPNYVSTNTFNNLLEGSYVAAVRDANNCVGTLILSVREPSELMLSIVAKSDATCSANGSISVAAGGGTISYAYFVDAPAVGAGNLTGVFTNLSVGNHIARVRDANGCIKALPFVIGTGAGLNLTSVVVSNVLCNGANNGSATITVSGGATPYQYLWDNGSPVKGVSNLSAGVHTVIVTDAKGCTAIDQVTITQPSAINITNIMSPVLCNNAATGSLSFAVNTAGSYIFNLNTGISNQSGFFGSLAAGTYTVTVNAGNNCTATASVVLTQTPTTIAASTTVTNSVSCFGGSNGAVTINASGGSNNNYGFVLNSNNGGASASNSTGSFSNLPQGNYTVIVRDANSCSTQTTFAIGGANSLPTAAITNISHIKCAGGTNGAFTIVPSGGTASGATPYTYSVNGSPSPATVTSLTAGVYAVTITDANMCTATTFVNINPAQPLFVSTTTTAIPCNGATATVSATTTGGATGTMLYTINTMPVQPSNTGVFNNISVGNYIVIATDVNMCSAQTTLSIIQPTAIVININTPVAASCQGASNGTATIIAVGGGSTSYTYEITGKPIQQTGIFTGLAAGTYIVTVTAGGTSGCTATRSFDILQPSNAISATAGTPSNILCRGGNDAFAAITINGGTAPYTLSSSPSAIIGNNILYGLSAGTYAVTVRDANGCTANTSVTVTEPNTSLAASTIKQSIKCFGDANGSFTAQGIGGTAPYTYSFDGGTTFIPTIPTSGSVSSALTLATGTYTIIVKDANRCSTLETVYINQPAQLVVVATPTNISCLAAGGSATIAAQGGAGGFTYSKDGITFLPSNIITGLPLGISTITVKDVNGCTATTTVTITAADALMVEARSDKAEICAGQQVNLTALGSGGTGIRTYDWGTGIGTGSAIAVTPTATTVYNVIVSNPSGCTNVASVTVIVNASPSIGITGTAAICAGQSATIIATGGDTYQWNNGVIIDRITVTQADIYNVIATSTKGCTASKTAALQVRALPAVSAGADIRVYDGENFNLNATGAGTGGSYTWILGDGLDATNTPNPKGHIDVNTTFVVEATDQYGCKNTDEVLVEIKDELECIGSTSGFTPNADGINDTWVIPCLQYYPDNNLEIINRWGQPVFSARNYNNDFGGIYNGTTLPDGTYYYIVNINASLLKKSSYKGTITILR